jgi:hypothetical protein
MSVAAMARHYNKPISHGNGSSRFQSAPQPDGDCLHVSQAPALGFDPKPALIEAYKVKH